MDRVGPYDKVVVDVICGRSLDIICILWLLDLMTIRCTRSGSQMVLQTRAETLEGLLVCTVWSSSLHTMGRFHPLDRNISNRSLASCLLLAVRVVCRGYRLVFYAHHKCLSKAGAHKARDPHVNRNSTGPLSDCTLMEAP